MKQSHLHMVFLTAGVISLSGCNGMYLTSPAHPYEWATPESERAAIIDERSRKTTTHLPPDDANKQSDIISQCQSATSQNNWHMQQNIFPKVVCVDMVLLTGLENEYYSATDSKIKINDRDRWVQTLMRDVDVLWWGYKNGFLTNYDSTKVTTETIVTGAAAASAGFAAKSTKTALAVLAATLNGFNTSFDKDVLANQMAPVLFTAAEADRTKIESQIIEGLKQDTDHYSLAVAARDVMRYANAGSISSALASLGGQAGQAMTSAQQERDATSISSATAPGSVTPSVSGNDVTLQFKPPTESGGAPVIGYQVVAQPKSGTATVAYFPNDGSNQVMLPKLPDGGYTVKIWAITSGGPGASSATNVTVPQKAVTK